MSSNQPVTPAQQRQLNIAKIMAFLDLPKAYKTNANENNENLLKKEEQMLQAELSSKKEKVKKLKRSIKSLTKKDKADVDIAREEIKSQKSIIMQAKIALAEATKQKQATELEYGDNTKKSLIDERTSISKNETQMLGTEKRNEQESTKKRAREIAEEEKRAHELKATEKQQEKTQKESVQKTTNQPSIAVALLRQIYKRAENKALFTNINDTDFETLKKEAKLLLERHQTESFELTEKEHEMINNVELETLKRDVKPLFDRYQTEVDASMVRLTQSEYEKVSKLLAKQKTLIQAKITQIEEQEKNEVVKPKVHPEIQRTQEAEKKYDNELKNAESILTKKVEHLSTLPAVALPKLLESSLKDLTDYQQELRDKDTLRNKAVESLESRKKKIQLKEKIHTTVKADVVAQIKANAMKKDSNRMQKESGPELESAVEYCIAQLEGMDSSNPKALKALKEKCENAGWKPAANGAQQTKTGNLTYLTPSKTILQMSDILELTYYAYLEKALQEKRKPLKGGSPAPVHQALPTLNAELEAHKKSLQKTAEQPEATTKPTVVEQKPEQQSKTASAKPARTEQTEAMLARVKNEKTPRPNTSPLLVWQHSPKQMPADGKKGNKQEQPPNTSKPHPK